MEFIILSLILLFPLIFILIVNYIKREKYLKLRESFLNSKPQSSDLEQFKEFEKSEFKKMSKYF